MIGVIIATHGHLAETFLEVAEEILGKQKDVVAVGVMPQDGKKEISEHLIQAVSHVRQADGILILTGIFGESDCQISLSLFAGQHVRIVTGLNLPMLFKVLTYRSKLTLKDLAICACESGRSGIIECQSGNEQAIGQSVNQSIKQTSKQANEQVASSRCLHSHVAKRKKL